MKLIVLPVLVACAALVSPVTAHAQMRPAPFAETSLLVDSDYAAGGEHGLTHTAGTSAAFGVPFTHRFSLRFGIDIPQRHSDEDLAGTWTSRTTTYSVLLARDYRQTDRVQFAFLVGVGIMKTSEQLTNRQKGWESLPSSKSSTWFAPTIGFQVPILLTRHLALVPQFRWHSGLVGLLMNESSHDQSRDLRRGMAGIRWRF